MAPSGSEKGGGRVGKGREAQTEGGEEGNGELLYHKKKKRGGER